MSLLDADDAAIVKPFEPRKVRIEFVETPNGDWYMNVLTLKGDRAISGNFRNRYPLSANDTIVEAIDFIREVIT